VLPVSCCSCVASRALHFFPSLTSVHSVYHRSRASAPVTGEQEDSTQFINPMVVVKVAWTSVLRFRFLTSCVLDISLPIDVWCPAPDPPTTTPSHDSLSLTLYDHSQPPLRCPYRYDYDFHGSHPSFVYDTTTAHFHASLSATTAPTPPSSPFRLGCFTQTSSSLSPTEEGLTVLYGGRFGFTLSFVLHGQISSLSRLYTWPCLFS
jgi:hypothetical protein